MLTSSRNVLSIGPGGVLADPEPQPRFSRKIIQIAALACPLNNRENLLFCA